MQPLPLLTKATNAYIKHLFSAPELQPAAQQSRSGGAFSSVGQRFAADLTELLSTLRRTELHFIRCATPMALCNPRATCSHIPTPLTRACLALEGMKPNLKMQPNVFDAPYVRTRIAAAGSLAALKFTKKLQGGSELQVSTLARLRRPPHAAALPAELREGGAADCDDVEFARALLGCLGLPPHTLRVRDEGGSPRVEIASGLLPFLVAMEAQGAAADAAAVAGVAELAAAVRSGESAAARRQAERGATKQAAEQRATQLREAPSAPPPAPQKLPSPTPGPRHALVIPPKLPPMSPPKTAPTKPTKPTGPKPTKPTGPKPTPKSAPTPAPTPAPTLAPRSTPQPRPRSAPQTAPQHTPAPAPATRPTEPLTKASEPLTPPSIGQEMASRARGPAGRRRSSDSPEARRLVASGKAAALTDGHKPVLSRVTSRSQVEVESGRLRVDSWGMVEQPAAAPAAATAPAPVPVQAAVVSTAAIPPSASPVATIPFAAADSLPPTPFAAADSDEDDSRNTGDDEAEFSVDVGFTNPLLGKMSKEAVHRKMSHYAELERNSSAAAAATATAPTAKKAKEGGGGGGGSGSGSGGGSACAAQQQWLRSIESDEQVEKEAQEANMAKQAAAAAALLPVFNPLDAIGAQALPGGGATVSTRGDTVGVEGVTAELPFLRTPSFLAGGLSMRGLSPLTDREEVEEQEEQEEVKVPWSIPSRRNSAAELAGIGVMLREREERAEWHEARERRVAALRAARAAAASVAPRRTPLPLVAGDSMSQVVQHLDVESPLPKDQMCPGPTSTVSLTLTLTP